MAQSSKPGSYRNTKAWKELRLKVLADYPTCAWCKRRPSTDCDHVIPVDAGIDPMDRSNLVGACSQCNSRRGAQHVNSKRQKATQRPQRPKRAREPDPVLGSRAQPPPVPSASYIARTEADDVETSVLEAERQQAGRIEPRLHVGTLGGETFGPEVAAWAQRHLGTELMDWQRIALDGQLRHNGGELVHREALVSVARQNGKTVALKALAGWWLTDMAKRRGTPQTVFLTAHKLDRAHSIFLELEPVLEKMGGKSTRSYGRASVDMPDGSQMVIRAATPTNAHGGTNDLIIVDEVWSVAPAVVFDALRPSQIARQSPLLSMWSTAGDESSTVMLQLREQAINAIDAGRDSRLYFAEWSPPPGAPLHDRESWRWANPALGTTITFDALEAASATPDQSAFYRAHLNVWIASASSWLPIGVWDQCVTTTAIPGGGVVAIDSSLDESRYCAVRAVNVDGIIHVASEFVVDSAAAMWSEIDRLLAERDVQLAITPGLFAVAKPEVQRRSNTVGMSEQYTYTPIVRSLVLEERLVHADQQNLAEHVGRAVLIRSQNSMALSSQKSPGPIELARCMVWAAGLAAKHTAKVRKPMFAAS